MKTAFWPVYVWVLSLGLVTNGIVVAGERPTPPLPPSPPGLNPAPPIIEKAATPVSPTPGQGAKPDPTDPSDPAGTVSYFGGKLKMVPQKKEPPKPRVEFELYDGDRILFLGDTWLERENSYGYIESQLSVYWPERNFTFRNLSWSGDSPLGRSRASFDWTKGEEEWFKQLKAQIEAVNPTVVFLGYGMAASFDGLDALPKFKADLARLADFILGMNKEKPVRIVMLSPIRHERLTPPMPEAWQHNKVIEKYIEGMQELANARKISFINLFKALGDGMETPLKRPFTENGIHPNAFGFHRIAETIAAGLNWVPTSWRFGILENGTLRRGSEYMTVTNIFRGGPGAKFRMKPFYISPPFKDPQGGLFPHAAYDHLLQVQNLGPGTYRLLADGKEYFRLDATNWNKGFTVTSSPDFDQAEELRNTIVKKNQLFFYRWRPQNQTYLFGFRRHEQGQNAKEIPQFDPLIAELEKKILELKQPKWRDYEVAVLPTERNPTTGGPTAKPAPQSAPSQPPKEANAAPALKPTGVKSLLSEFEVAPGFEMNLYAEDPLLHKPIHMNFDTQGRLWVASSEVYPQIMPGQIANDKILLLEDTDGDGKVDKSTVFADGLLIPTGIAPGDGGVYVGQSTELLFFKDNDGDGKADERRVVLSGFGTEDTHHIVHTLRWGMDGALYFNQSIYIHSHIETPTGVQHLNSGGIWKFRPNKGELGVFVRGFCNPWGHAFDDWGQSFITDGAGFQGISHGVPGAMYFTYAGARRIMDSISPGTYPKFCGLDIVESGQFPDDWQGTLITSDFRAHRVVHFGISEAGSSYATKELPDLVRTTNVTFRPIDVKFGPDGALYIADWSNPIIQHGEVDFRDARRDKEHGRIWRVTAKRRPLVKPDFNQFQATVKLIEDTLSKSGYIRDRARRILAERGKRAVNDVRTWAKTHNSDREQLTALWISQSVDDVNPILLGNVLRSEDPHARAAAVRVLAEWAPRIKESQELLSLAVSDDHPRVRLEAVRVLATMPDARSAALALSVLDKPMDPTLEYALWLTVNDLAKPWLAAIQSGEWKTDGREKQLEYGLKAIEPAMASVVLGQMKQVQSLPKEGTGPWIELIGQAGGTAEVSALFERTLSGGFDDAATARVLNSLGAAFKSRNVRPSGNLEGVTKLFASSDPVKVAALKLAGIWKLSSAAATLLKTAQSESESGLARAAAIDGLKELGGQSGVSALQTLATTGADSPFARGALLALATLDMNQAMPLLARAFSAMDDEKTAMGMFQELLTIRGSAPKLASGLSKAKLNPVVAKAGLRAVRQSGRSDVALESLFAGASGSEASSTLTDSDLKALAASAAQSGNPARGEDIFRRPILACVNCHAIGGAGGKVGPDLTSIGASAPADYLVESLYFPNRKIKEGYHAIQIQTKDGEDLSGILVRDASHEVVIRDASNREISIPKANIQNRTIGGSLMPSGLVELLPKQEVLDLVRFLSELGKPGPFDASKGGVARVWRAMAGKHTLEQFGEAKVAASDMRDSEWTPVLSLVDGRVPRSELEALAGKERFVGVVGVYAGARFQASKNGPVTLKLSGDGIQSAWLDGKPLPVSAQFKVDVSQGRHTLMLRLDPRKLPEGLKVQSSDVTFLAE